MADITYKREFQHDDWIDNEDIVQAGGESGFNSKFHGLEKEFDKLSGVIAQINSSLVPVVPATTLTFAAAFFRRGSITPWTVGDDKAEASFEEGDVEGWMPVQLPDGTKIQKIIIIGARTDTATAKVKSLVIQLQRRSLGGDSELLISVPLVNTPTNPFRIERTLTTVNLVDNKNNQYQVIATASGDSGAAAQLSALQVICVQG
jgi:hypothetical protein